MSLTNRWSRGGGSLIVDFAAFILTISEDPLVGCTLQDKTTIIFTPSSLAQPGDGRAQAWCTSPAPPRRGRRGRAAVTPPGPAAKHCRCVRKARGTPGAPTRASNGCGAPWLLGPVEQQIEGLLLSLQIVVLVSCTRIQTT